MVSFFNSFLSRFFFFIRSSLSGFDGVDILPAFSRSGCHGKTGNGRLDESQHKFFMLNVGRVQSHLWICKIRHPLVEFVEPKLGTSHL